MTDQELTKGLDRITEIVKANSANINNISSNVERLIVRQDEFSGMIARSIADLAKAIEQVDASIAIKKGDPMPDPIVIPKGKPTAKHRAAIAALVSNGVMTVKEASELLGGK